MWWYIAGGGLLAVLIGIVAALLVRNRFGFDAEWLHEKWWMPVLGCLLIWALYTVVVKWDAEQQEIAARKRSLALEQFFKQQQLQQRFEAEEQFKKAVDEMLKEAPATLP